MGKPGVGITELDYVVVGAGSWIDRATTDESGALTWWSTRVIGLGCDSDTFGGWLVLDLPALDLTWPTPASALSIGPTTA